MKLLMIEPRGFCAGVERAINIVNETLKLIPPPIYINHEIVHNSHVIDKFKKQGVIFTEDISKIPEKATIIFNAHGVSPTLVSEARKKNLRIIDATCPLVSKVHLEVLHYTKKNYYIILIGHKNHPEVIGLLGHNPEKIYLIEKIEDINKLPFNKETKLAYVTQTTLSTYDCQKIIDALKNKFPKIIGPQKSDICYATTNRQEAIRSISKKIQAILIIGSHNSSNSNRLREVAESEGCQSFLINQTQDINLDELLKFKVIAISAGASTPETIVQKIVTYLKNNLEIQHIETFTQKKENIHFTLPKIN